MIDILRATAARHPSPSAIEDSTGTLSYAELEAVQAGGVERARAGVRRGDWVGVRCPSRIARLYLAILSVLAAGAAYVPVDADDPPERAELVFGEAAGVAGVLTEQGYRPARETVANRPNPRTRC